uniref:Uncharacterized protein n=1 Tax=Candidatus Methanogaster sp. ANME-2c ERB4 TaxID=2759911 RepID=A0A7G9Y1G4_9EURY|nr:hypothetical protein BDEPBIDA_00002 [Methanosarcinales archaeon ANME-2c ERB4]
MCMAECDCERVSSVIRNVAIDLEHHLDHLLHLLLVRPTRPGDRLLNLIWRVLEDIEVILGCCEQDDSACMAHLDC